MPGSLALAVTGVLLAGLRKLGRDPRTAVLWAWCPTVAFEAGNDAHVDVLAAGLTVASLVVLARARTRGRAAVGGSLLGLAVATKLYPALVAPAIVRRRPVAVASAAVAAVAAVYLPHLLAVGGHVLGYLPGYLRRRDTATARDSPCYSRSCRSVVRPGGGGDHGRHGPVRDAVHRSAAARPTARW